MFRHKLLERVSKVSQEFEAKLQALTDELNKQNRLLNKTVP